MFFTKRQPRWEKIRDPAAHAARNCQGPFQLAGERDFWGAAASFFTTTAHFGSVGGVTYRNNCGPTAVTNLICMYRQKKRGQTCGIQEARAVYDRVARLGVRNLYFINSASRLFHGTSDLRAGGFLRRSFFRLEGIRPRVRLRWLSCRNALKSLDQNALLYLMLLRHPEYGSHHLVGYGYVTLKNPSTGQVKTYLKISDGHNPGPRYLDTADLRRRPGAYYEVRFPKERFQ